MAQAHQDEHASGGEFDLSQFHEIFFEEARENLDLMEQLLIGFSSDSLDDETLNGIFRCAHSVKGGAATFGFSDVVALTHQMESLLDRLRRHEIPFSASMVEVLLESADISRAFLARHEGVSDGDVPDASDLIRRLAAMSAGQVPEVQAPVVLEVLEAVVLATPNLPAHGVRSLVMRIGPLARLSDADEVIALFLDIPDLGHISELDSPDAKTRIFAVKTTSTNDDLLDLFSFHVAKELIDITESAPPAAVDFPVISAPVTEKLVVAADEDVGGKNSHKAPEKAHNLAVSTEAQTLRVSISKVDQLINLVGELVITQAMMAQNSQSLGPELHQKFLTGLSDLARNTRDLQESVMSIRMIPMSVVFSRFPRMLRDLAIRLGKNVDFITQGETTELDKGLVEKIIDPLTHLVRNSCDHGIELPAERVRLGKPEKGTISLSAVHQGGSILIEVRDDGRGMSRKKILAKARENGLDVSDQMPDAAVWQLIFAPGFSTSDVVTDVSGRGVGMDVVKRNISALNGSVEIDSVEGQGLRISVRLPLTLAIMDGMSVSVGDEVYILPLSSVVESFLVDDRAVSTIGNSAQLVKVREEYMPVVDLEALFQIPRHVQAGDRRIMVVIESSGSRVALLVDELLGQQQVVVKNLESNYRKVDHISGATILGDGKVALILDTGSLVRRSRH
jgi:two-component system chemotaxis sensor kinase CheA